jgi:hypothetical protein
VGAQDREIETAEHDLYDVSLSVACSDDDDRD